MTTRPDPRDTDPLTLDEAGDHWRSDPGTGCGLMFLALLAFWVIVLVVVFFVWVPSWH